MATDDAPVGTPVGRIDQIAVQPGLLTTSHQSTAGVVFNLFKVRIVTIHKIRDRAVVYSGVQHENVNQGSKLELSPNTKVVVHLDLPLDTISRWSFFKSCIETTHLMGNHSKNARTAFILR